MQNNFTISKKNNSYVWLPVKTASSTLSWILGHFDFSRSFIDGNNNVIMENDILHFGHSTVHPPNSENLTFICSMRNPYDRFFSFFKMTTKFSQKLITKENFDIFFEEEMSKKSSLLQQSANIFEKRKPDFLIRSENFYEDLVKIPFIGNSKLNNCGILEEMCQKKIWKTVELNIDDFISTEQKQQIYILFKEHFEIGGYSK